jgi:UPF0755 protein
MKTKVLQTFRVTFLFVLAFVIFHALNQSSESEVVIIEHGKDKEQVVEEMLEDGFLRKDFSYYFLKLTLALKGDVEPGGYLMKKGMGAVTAALSLEDPEYRFVAVNSGQRKGEIADNLGEVLDWDEKKIKEFGTQYPACELIGQEGFLATGRYLIHKDEEPEIVQLKMEESMRQKLEDLDVTENDVVAIASLIQREAAGKSDMRLISGIIHNRLEEDMPLQIDATLQYIKGEEGNWWPVPKADDKYLDSQLNTYQNTGVPPAPIATPSDAALKAAMNPLPTDCLYYLHDRWGNIHCSTTYEGHKRNVNYYLR